MQILPRHAVALLLTALAGLAAPASAAVSLEDLLPVDQAFALTVKADGPDRVRLDWAIADGYYLYRERIKVAGVDGTRAGAPDLPHGEPHEDEFFGHVETFRRHLTGHVPATGSGGGIRLRITYQGCADAGICYPPQTRVLAVAPPVAAGTTTGHGDETAGDAGFAALGRALGGTPQTGPLAGDASTNGRDAVPLPEARAFAFDAIAADGDTLLLRFTPAPGYYLYRDKTRLSLDADGIALAAPRWPAGRAHRDEHFGDVVVYFDEVEVPVPLRRTTPEARMATLTATFQGCQDGGICYPPMTRTVRVPLPAGHVAATGDAQAGADAGTDAGNAAATAPASGESPEGANGATSAGTDATPPAADMPRTPPPADALQRAAGSRRPVGLFAALLLALGGGLVLNLMPCVLPVLSLKALALAQSGPRARGHALWYTVGVMASFLALGATVLALRAAGDALGWGFQLQRPWIVGLLAYVMFAVGLSLSGVFTVGLRLAGAGQSLASKPGRAGDFFTGVLAVVVASPCTAPFMATALAFAFAAPIASALLVFAALGLGLALPFLLIGFVPALAQRLPRPGAWMETLKQVLAFPMYLTAVWLLWVLGQQRGIDAVALALAGLVLLALAAWWLERLRFRAAPLQRVLAVALLALALVPLAMAARLPRPQAETAADAAGVVPYSAASLAELRAQGRVVFVDMTADWCVTCKANEKAVLSRDAFRDAMRRADAVLMQGDWTDVDPEITHFLEAHHAVGVPLYVVFPRGGGEGEVLPAVLTPGIVEDALARAAR